MHESGMIQRLLQTALSEAQRQGGKLVGIDVRLGALAGGSAEHLREHFEEEARAMDLNLTLEIVESPMHPAGVEITGISVARR